MGLWVLSSCFLFSFLFSSYLYSMFSFLSLFIHSTVGFNLWNRSSGVYWKIFPYVRKSLSAYKMHWRPISIKINSCSILCFGEYESKTLTLQGPSSTGIGLWNRIYVNTNMGNNINNRNSFITFTNSRFSSIFSPPLSNLDRFHSNPIHSSSKQNTHPAVLTAIEKRTILHSYSSTHYNHQRY